MASLVEKQNFVLYNPPRHATRSSGLSHTEGHARPHCQSRVTTRPIIAIQRWEKELSRRDDVGHVHNSWFLWSLLFVALGCVCVCVCVCVFGEAQQKCVLTEWRVEALSTNIWPRYVRSLLVDSRSDPRRTFHQPLLRLSPSKNKQR